MRLIPISLFLALSLAVASCGSDSGSAADSIQVSEAWSRQPAAGQKATAGYATVSNSGSSDVRIVSANADVTDITELHETLMDDAGAMSMQEVEEGFVVPAGGSFVFEPGGPHIMLMGIDADSYPSSVDLELVFEDGTSIKFAAEVRSIAGN